MYRVHPRPEERGFLLGVSLSVTPERPCIHLVIRSIPRLDDSPICQYTVRRMAASRSPRPVRTAGHDRVQARAAVTAGLLLMIVQNRVGLVPP